MLGWSAIDLADNSAVGIASVKRYEIQNGIPSANTTGLLRIKAILEKKGKGLRARRPAGQF